MSDQNYSEITITGGRVHLGNTYYSVDESGRKRADIIKWLNPEDPSVEHHDLREKVGDATGAWLTTGSEYKCWKNAKNSFLWLKGGAGAGKSVLCSTVIENVQAEQAQYPGESDHADAYWYFTFANQQKQSARACLHSIIAQLYRRCKETPDVLLSKFDASKDGQHQLSHTALLEILHAIIKEFSSVFIIIDALDECPKTKVKDGRKMLLETVHKVLSWKCPSLHLLCTSRNEIDISIAFDRYLPEEVTLQVIQIKGKEVAADIDYFLQSKLAEPDFDSWSPRIKEKVTQKLINGSDGMFRLVALQIEDLSGADNENEIDLMLDNLPSTLDEFHERLLYEIKQDKSARALRALQWLAFAVRPISVKELAEAMVVDHDREPYVDPHSRYLNAQDIFKILPAGLVTTISVSDDDQKRPFADSLVRLAHYSVEEYLTSSRIRQSRVSFYQIDEMEAHKVIAGASLSCLLQDAPKIPELSAASGVVKGGYSIDLSPVLTSIPLLHYASLCWPYHIRHLGDRTTESLTSRIVELFTDECALRFWTSVYFRYSEQMYFGNVNDNFNLVSTTLVSWTNKHSICPPMNYASRFGMLPVVQALISHGWPIRGPKSKYEYEYIGHPLDVAAFYGHKTIARTLISAGADVNAQGGVHGNALHAASAGGHLELVKLLLEEGADVNAQGGKYGNALQAASAGGHLEFVKLLLQEGADVNAQGGLYGNALQAASLRGHLELAKLLLQEGADVNIQGGYYGNALQAASVRGHVELAKLLLHEGAHPVTYKTSRKIRRAPLAQNQEEIARV